MFAPRIAIAIVGLPGAGKTETTQMLADKFQFQRVYFGQVVLDEMAARGVEANSSNERCVREDLRATYGMDVIAARSLERIRALLEESKDVCIDGLYSVGEQRLLASQIGLVTIAVHAPRWLRKARLASRPHRPLTSDEVDARDIAEVEQLDKAEPIALADTHIVNDGSRESLYADLKSLLDCMERIATARIRSR